jgi:hypothetical protein
MQGCGVRAPWAAAVAAATCGFAGDEHIPNGATFNIGAWSIIVAAGLFVVVTMAGITVKLAGALPIAH